MFIPHSTPSHHIIKCVFGQQLPKLMHTKKLCLPDSHLAYLPATHSPPKCRKQSSFSLWLSLNLVAAASKRWKIQHFLCNAECPCVNVLRYRDFRSAFPIPVTSLYYLCYSNVHCINHPRLIYSIAEICSIEVYAFKIARSGPFSQILSQIVTVISVVPWKLWHWFNRVS